MSTRVPNLRPSLTAGASASAWPDTSWLPRLPHAVHDSNSSGFVTPWCRAGLHAPQGCAHQAGPSSRPYSCLIAYRVHERTADLHMTDEALRHEIAERRRLEHETRRAEHFALLGRLAASVSHDIRNPLSAIVLHVDLVE